VANRSGTAAKEPGRQARQEQEEAPTVADLLKQLENEHREAESLMDRLEQAEEPSERGPLLRELEGALSQHMEKEERRVYPVLAEIDGEGAEAARAEHDGARELLEKLRSGGVDQPGFGSIAAALKGAIGHHVEEEENDLFPKLRREVGAERFADGAPATTNGRDPSSSTRHELYEQAKQLGIDGRSSMTKDQLAKAVEKAGSRS
jgi:iron-sulfur cluster repair protein YtfE (RIC family)